MHPQCVGRYPTIQDIMALNNNYVGAVTNLIKGRVGLVRGQIWDDIKPYLIIIQKSTRIPICTTSQDDMQQGVPFLITKWAKCNVRKAIPDADGITYPSLVRMCCRPPATLMDLLFTSFLYQSSWTEEWWSLLAQSMHTVVGWQWQVHVGFFMTPPAVTIGILVIWWLSMSWTSTVWSDFSLIQISSPAMPPLAPLSTSEPTLQNLWAETRRCNTFGPVNTWYHWSQSPHPWVEVEDLHWACSWI